MTGRRRWQATRKEVQAKLDAELGAVAQLEDVALLDELWRRLEGAIGKPGIEWWAIRLAELSYTATQHSGCLFHEGRWERQRGRLRWTW